MTIAMITMTAFMQAMNNPQAYVVQQCQQMFANKNRKQQLAELQKLYKPRGMALNTIARQYEVNL